MIETVIKEIKKLDKTFKENRKTGHFTIKMAYYEGGLTKPKKEVLEDIVETDRELED